MGPAFRRVETKEGLQLQFSEVSLHGYDVEEVTAALSEQVLPENVEFLLMRPAMYDVSTGVWRHAFIDNGAGVGGERVLVEGRIAYDEGFAGDGLQFVDAEAGLFGPKTASNQELLV